MKSIYLTYRVYISLGIIIFIIACSYVLPFLFYIGLLGLVALVAVVLYEYRILRRIAATIISTRTIRSVWSLGEEHQIDYITSNPSKLPLYITIVDELPYQLQEREEIDSFIIEPDADQRSKYFFRPIKRGEYQFGNLQLFISLSTIRFVEYRKSMDNQEMSKVFPSVLQMRRFALQIFSMTATMFGIRRIRTIGENDEFEHLRQYQQGDNIKSINWKATSRRGELIVNQYQDSRSQNVYCIIDKGRSMEMPFDGLSLLDYSINAALVISNIVLSKYDKAGLISFSKEIDTYLKADSNKNHLQIILKTLYNQETVFEEPGFENLYVNLRNRLSRRSILFLFTNFESISDLEKNIKYLKALSRKHLLVTICFENPMLEDIGKKEASTIDDIYTQTIASSYHYEKKKIIRQLQLFGIQTIYTKPQDLSINVINKYLELKAKRMK